MNQISLTEILFEQLLSYFENCKRNGERRMNIVIGIDNGIIEFKRLIPELKISIIDPQLNRLFKLSKLILEEWNKEIYQLDKNGELRCIHIHDDYTVSRKNNVIGFDKWSELYPKARMYSLDVLIDFVNDFNGYCADNFNLELPPPNENKNEKKYFTKYHALAYIFDCDVKGEAVPIGQKMELEKIGNRRMGEGKGNTFYKEVDKAIRVDRNTKNGLIDVIGEDWREAVLKLSDDSKALDEYLKSKLL